MKYIFLLFCVIGGQLLLVSEIYAQRDTLTIELRNIPIKRCSTSYDYQYPSHGGCDSAKLFSFKQIIYLDSIVRNRGGDTIRYFNNTSNRTGQNGFIDTTRVLTIFYDTTKNVFKSLNFVLYTDEFEPVRADPWKLVAQSGGAYSLTFIPVWRNGRVLSASFRGSEILQHSFSYRDYSEDWYYTSSLGTPTYSGIFDSSVVPINDSSFISINLSTEALLGVISPSHSSAESLRIYPNPATNSLTVIGWEKKLIEFFDILGRKLQIPITNHIDNQYNFDISTLPPGIYYLRAGNQMQKFVIQR